jgi:hypothetical protein
MCALLSFLNYQNPGNYPALPASDLENLEKAKAAALAHALKIDGRIFDVANTGSMRPTIDGTPFVVGEKAPYETLKEGDIITYNPKWNKGKSIMHRLVKKDKGGWIASGDNNKRSESWERVTPETYDSKIVAVYRFPAPVATP